MDQLRAMRTFVEIARRGGFAAAARALDLAPSVVTRLVADLEHQLGARLLTRSTRRVALTSIGESYLERARSILSDVDAAAALVSRGQTELAGCVRMAAPPLFAATQLIPRLARLQERHPGMRIEVAAESAPDRVGESYDLSIVLRADAPDGNFVAHRLSRHEVLLCAAPRYLRDRGRPRHPLDLTDHALLTASLPLMPRQVVFTDGAGASVEVKAPHGALHSSNAAMCHAGVLAGMGIAALPNFAIQTELEQGRLERVLPDWHLFDVAAYACFPSRRPLPAVVRTLLAFLRSEFADPPVRPLERRPMPATALRLAT